MKYWSIGLFVSLTFLLFTCQSDKSGSKTTSLEGKWVLVEGFRGGKKTETLKDIYFTFTPNTMSTNLPVPIKGGKDSSYTVKENTISQQFNKDFTLDYTIQKLTDKRLELATNLRGWDFTFILERSRASN